MGESLADLNALHAGNGHDVSCGNRFGFVALEPAEGKELGDARGLQRAIEFDNAHFVAAVQSTLKDARNSDAAEVIAVIEVGDLNLQGFSRITGGWRNGVQNGLEEKCKIAGAIAAQFVPPVVRDAGFGIGVEHGKIELVFGGIEVDEKAVDFVQDGDRTRVG